MPSYLSQEDFFHRYYEEFGGGLEPSEENLQMVRNFVLEKWRERALEKGVPPEKMPDDLSDSCKFTALFGSVVFSADIAGNYSHVFNMVEGKILDINADASDVKGRDGIHRHDSDFIESYAFRQSMKDCRERVRDWLQEFAAIYAQHSQLSSAPGL
jgi:hypothetical protein